MPSFKRQYINTKLNYQLHFKCNLRPRHAIDVESVPTLPESRLGSMLNSPQGGNKRQKGENGAKNTSIGGTRPKSTPDQGEHCPKTHLKWEHVSKTKQRELMYKTHHI